MKTTYFSIIALLVLITASAPAFAIDQVTLKNGQVVEGTVLNDVPNQHVDIRLINGDTKRFQKSEVSDVSRDVPSRKDRTVYGNQTLGFVAVNLGGSSALQGAGNKNVVFDYGVKIGGMIPPFSDTKIGFALSFDHSNRSIVYGAATGTANYNDINVQMLLLRIANTGFYFGPNVGLEISSGSFDNSPIQVQGSTDFEVGAGAGYEVFLSNRFSVGPDVRYDHVFSSNQSGDLIKFTLQGSMHF